MDFPHRPHNGLRHPVLPKTRLTPNEIWGALTAVAGHVPVPLSGRYYLELLPVRWLTISDHGIRLGRHTYDHDLLGPYRGRPSPTTARAGRREVHHNPHDLRQIWIRLPDHPEGLVEIPWIHRDHIHQPFDDRVWQHICTTAVRRRDHDQHEADLAQALDDLIRRAAAGTHPAVTGLRLAAEENPAVADVLSAVPSGAGRGEDLAQAGPRSAGAATSPLSILVVVCVARWWLPAVGCQAAPSRTCGGSSVIGLGALAGIAAVEFGMVLTPGPNMIYLVSRSIAQGRRAGLTSLAGVALGFLVYLFAVSAGIATVFALVPEIYLAIKLAGAGYLLWLAWKAVRPGGRSAFATQELAQDGTRKLFLMGFLTCLLNPKVAILYISLLPQFVDPARGHVGLQGLLLGLTQIAVGVAGNAFFIVTAGSVAGFFAQHPLWQRLHRYAMGTALAGFAVRIATERTSATVALP
jgi:threonine/homoserine/homoserine lactone efflux protein